MATSLGTLIETTRHALSGFDANRESVTALASPLSASATTVSIEEATATSGAGVGVAEIDFELVRVKAVNPTDSTLTLYGFGRGYRGTTAAAHLAGVEVRFNPSWPAFSVAREINGVLQEVYPMIYAVAEHSTTIPSDYGAVDLPVAAVGVISVWIEDDSRADQWLREDRWSYNPDSTETATGKGLRIFGSHIAGTNVRIKYATRPTPFNLAGATTQDFATVTGLDERIADLIQLGVAMRMAPFIDVAKLPHLSAEAREMGEAKRELTGANAARLLRGLFQLRLDQEAAVLRREHPIRAHYTGVKI